MTPITAPGLRHTNATLEPVANKKIVSDHLGLFTVAYTLNRYNHASTDQQRDTAEPRVRRIFDEPMSLLMATNPITTYQK